MERLLQQQDTMVLMQRLVNDAVYLESRIFRGGELYL